MNNLRSALLGTLVLAPLFAIGCGSTPIGMPPCTAGVAGCVAPGAGWPVALQDVQAGEQWAVFDAHAVWEALPPEVQAKHKVEFETDMARVITADAAWVSAVNAAIAAGNQNWAAATNDLIAAVLNVDELVNEIRQGATTPSPKADDLHARFQTMQRYSAR